MKKLVKEKLYENFKHEFYTNIEKETLNNKNFRKILFTGKNLQLVLMTLKPNEEIGLEIHKNVDQFFRFEFGKGKCIINDNEYIVSDGDCIIVPANTKHNIINIGKSDLKFYTIYAPPEH